MRQLDVLVATKDGRKPGGLEHLGRHTYWESGLEGWSKAANWLLGATDRDALFIDDDVTLLPSTFNLLDRYWDKADVFGFTLGHPTNKDHILSAGYAHVWETSADRRTRSLELRPVKSQHILTPCWVPHVTASLMVLKRSVLAKVRFPEWPGTHLEDIAFTLDCWLQGFKVAYLPGLALHNVVDLGNGGWAGATKGRDPKFHEEWNVNLKCLNEWRVEKGIYEAIQRGVIPTDPIPIVL